MTQDARQEFRVAPLTCEERRGLLEAALTAMRSVPCLWQLQTSNSFRRLGARGDGDVLCAVVQRHDGQPDLRGAPGVLDYIIATQPRVVLALLAALEEAEAFLPQGSSPDENSIQLNVSRDELRRIIVCVQHEAAIGPMRAEAETLAFADKLRVALGENSL